MNYQCNTSYKDLSCMFTSIQASNGDLSVHTVYCSDFQLVELGAANSTFFSCSLGHNFQHIDLFTNIKAFMNSINM